MSADLPYSWDEWVPESRLLKLNEAGFAKRRALLDAQAKKGRSTGGSGGAGSPGAGKGGLKDKKKDTKKRGRDAMESVRQLIVELQDADENENNSQESDFMKRPEVKIVIPDVLKLVLVDDWENVTKNNQLVALPRKPNVRELLEEYRQYASASKKQERSAQVFSLPFITTRSILLTTLRTAAPPPSFLKSSLASRFTLTRPSVITSSTDLKEHSTLSKSDKTQRSL